MTIRIAVMRHGNKSDDSLTPLGKRQIKAALEALIAQGFNFKRVAHSRTVRTRQCANIAIDTIKPIAGIIFNGNEEGLSFDLPFAKAFNGKMAPFTAEFQAIKEAGNTVADALRFGTYAKRCHNHLTTYLLILAEEMKRSRENDAICFSHSPLSSLAVPKHQAAQMPYDIPEAACVIYTIDNNSGYISNAELVLAPPVE
jgi:broad specificity phosphatase PhoE